MDALQTNYSINKFIKRSVSFAYCFLAIASLCSTLHTCAHERTHTHVLMQKKKKKKETNVAYIHTTHLPKQYILE